MAICNVQDLLSDAACFECLTPGIWPILELQLLCEILNAGGTGGGSANVAPGIVNPEGVVTGNAGQTYFNTANNTFWVKSSGTGTTTLWTQLI